MTTMETAPTGVRRLLPALTVLALALTCVAAAALVTGSADVSARQVFTCLSGRNGTAGDTVKHIIVGIRLPRVLAAGLAGSILAMTGLVSQTLFRNPLASPHVTGVTSGSAAGAVAGMLLLPVLPWTATIPLFGIVGGLLAAGAVYAIAASGRSLAQTVLLAGIAFGACFSALTSGALYLAGERLQTVVFWLMGGFWLAGWREVVIFALLAVMCFAILAWLVPAMNVLLTGEQSAHDLGVDVRRHQRLLLAVVAIGTAGVVGFAGTIGFVGLVVPHFLRLWLGGDHRRLLPACALGGAVLLLGADTLARTLAAPAEIPVGILTSMAGGPAFLWMLLHRTQGYRTPWA